MADTTDTGPLTGVKYGKTRVQRFCKVHWGSAWAYCNKMLPRCRITLNSTPLVSTPSAEYVLLSAILAFSSALCVGNVCIGVAARWLQEVHPAAACCWTTERCGHAKCIMHWAAVHDLASLFLSDHPKQRLVCASLFTGIWARGIQREQHRQECHQSQAETVDLAGQQHDEGRNQYQRLQAPKLPSAAPDLLTCSDELFCTRYSALAWENSDLRTWKTPLNHS